MKHPQVAHSSEVRAAPFSKVIGYEHSRPFLVDINNQGSDQQELYFYMNSNHEQTETYRTGFFGPYVIFTGLHRRICRRRLTYHHDQLCPCLYDWPRTVWEFGHKLHG